METIALLEILTRGEDSKHQFKENLTNVDSLAAEIVALANTQGGQMIIGVSDDGEITGLSGYDISRLNQLISNAASQSVKPPVNPITENINTDQGLVLVMHIAEGINRPYMDNQGRIWVKSGADKRHVTAREEMQRMFQSSNLVYADELPVNGTSLADLNIDLFEDYYVKRFGQALEDTEISLGQLLLNLGLACGSEMNLSGLLLFAKHPQRYRPAFIVKATTYPGNTLDLDTYLDAEDIEGDLSEVYQGMFAFTRRNLHKIQAEQSVNELGQLEIPDIVLEEIFVNALVHRDYFMASPIRLFIFRDRIELISPGHLPNHLTIDQIHYGNSNMRNPRLASHASKILPYRGMGTGIPRVLRAYPNVEIKEDRDANQLSVIVKRPSPVNNR